MSPIVIRELPKDTDLPCMSCDRFRSYAYLAEFVVTPAPNGPGTEWMCGRCFEVWREVPAPNEIPMKATIRPAFHMTYNNMGAC